MCTSCDSVQHGARSINILKPAIYTRTPFRDTRSYRLYRPSLVIAHQLQDLIHSLLQGEDQAFRSRAYALIAELFRFL